MSSDSDLKHPLSSVETSPQTETPLLVLDMKAEVDSEQKHPNWPPAVHQTVNHGGTFIQPDKRSMLMKSEAVSVIEGMQANKTPRALKTLTCFTTFRLKIFNLSSSCLQKNIQIEWTLTDVSLSGKLSYVIFNQISSSVHVFKKDFHWYFYLFRLWNKLWKRGPCVFWKQVSE